MIRIILILFVTVVGFYACSSNPTEQPKVEKKAEQVKPEEKQEKKKTILFFGNSLTAGYGLDKKQAFPALIQARLDSMGLSYNVVNAGNSGETTAGGAGRVAWILKQKIDLFVLELGGNDGLRGITPSASKENLQKIISTVKSTYPECKIVLAGMEAPPNMGADFTDAFRNMYKELAETNQLSLIPFLLEKVAGIEELNQTDGIHPTAEGHRLVAETVWETLKDIVE